MGRGIESLVGSSRTDGGRHTLHITKSACHLSQSLPCRGTCKPLAHPPQMDRHTSVASLLLKADLAPDPLERMLAISR